MAVQDGRRLRQTVTGESAVVETGRKEVKGVRKSGPEELSGQFELRW